MYCWDSLWSLPPSLTRTVAQGVEAPGSECEWVSCGVFHHAGSSLRFTERIRRLASYWWWTLRVMRGDDVPAQGRLRAPWRAPEQLHDRATGPGPMENAWAELDAETRDPELDWV
jgi:hypothetical protein